MSHFRSDCVTIAVLAAALLTLAAPPLLASLVACPRVAFSPALDGQLDDWPPLPQIAIAEPADWRPASAQSADYGGPEDISADVRLAWDGQALYVAIETRDDRMVRVRSAAEIDRGDSMVVCLAGEDSDQVNQFIVAMLRATSLVWRAAPAQGAGEVKTVGRALVARHDESGTRMVYELSIPWVELKAITPIPGGSFTLTTSICDDDGEGIEGCLERTATATLSTAGITVLEAAEIPGIAPRLRPLFPTPAVARFDEKCFIFNGGDALVLAGEVGYSLLPEAAWADRLSLLRAAGLNTVGVTVPWSHHQPSPAVPDLGRLRRFLDMCRSADLWVQLTVGPFVAETYAAGGVPGWVAAMSSPEDRVSSLNAWLNTLLPLVAEYQLARGGPIIQVVVRPLPERSGNTTAEALERLYGAVRSAGIVVPVIASNAPPARIASTQALASLVDSLSFYRPVAAGELAARLQALAREEIGPAVIAALPGSYLSSQSARQSADRVRLALARGAGAVTLSDFAPGLDPAGARDSSATTGDGIVDPAGACTPAYGEARLLGSFVSMFGPAVARATSVEGVIQADDPDVRALVRYGKAQSFLFLWDEKASRPHQVRLTYLEPTGNTSMSIPQAGTIYLPPGGAKILLLDLPIGRGVVRYCTSEVAAHHRLGERSLLVVYGDLDTPGELAMRLPGPPLVSGEVARQSWNAEESTLVLDYYHTAKDQYILVDEIVIVVLCRERAALIGGAVSGGQGVTLSTGGSVIEASLDLTSVKATVDCPQATVEATAALPQAPSSVTIDGVPVPFTFTTPERVVRFEIATPAFSKDQRSASVWERLGRVVLGGPAHLYARFDRALFTPDADAARGECASFDAIAGAPEVVGLVPGRFARLGCRFSAEGAAELAIRNSRYPRLVSINGLLVPALSGNASDQRADISAFLRSGTNQLEMTLEVSPRALGLAGLRDDSARVPEATLITSAGEAQLQAWEVCSGLAGEAAGYPAFGLEARDWHYILFGPWREQGKDLAEVWGVGWYRMSLVLPKADQWNIPYYVTLSVQGTGEVFFNGQPIGWVTDGGTHRIPVPSSLARPGDENVLAVALYGLSPQTGLYAAEISADQDRMTRRRKLEIRF